MSNTSSIPATRSPPERAPPSAGATARSADNTISPRQKEAGPSFTELLARGEPRGGLDGAPGAASAGGDVMRAASGGDAALAGDASAADPPAGEANARDGCKAHDEPERSAERRETADDADNPRAAGRDQPSDALRPTSARALQLSFEARGAPPALARGSTAAAAGGAAAAANAQMLAQRLLSSMSVRHQVDGSTALQLEVGSGRLRGLRVDLTLQGGQVAARMRAADAGAARLLDGAEEALSAALAKRGVELREVSVEVDPRRAPRRDGGSRGDSRQQQRDQPREQRQGKRAGRFALGVG